MLQLYKELRRLHRKTLPKGNHNATLNKSFKKYFITAMQTLGNKYISQEFRLITKNESTTPQHKTAFLNEWTAYKNTLLQQDGLRNKNLKVNLDDLSDQQIGQLYELKKEIDGRV